MKIFAIGERTKLTFEPGETVVLPAECRLFTGSEFGGYPGSHGLYRSDGNLQIHNRGGGWTRNIKYTISDGMVTFECPADGLVAVLDSDGSLLSINGDSVNCAHASYTYCTVCGMEDSEQLGEASPQQFECCC